MPLLHNTHCHKLLLKKQSLHQASHSSSSFSHQTNTKVVQPMESKLLPEILVETKNWTAKIIVAEKCPPKLSPTSITYQQLLLLDVKGNTVRATIYGRHIGPLAGTLKLGHTYLLSNANVRKAPPSHRRFVGELQWSITGGCNIVVVDESHYDLVFARIKISPFTELAHLKNTNVPITIIGMVIATKPMRPEPSKTGQEYMIRDIVLIDTSFEPINLRLYSAYAENEGREIANVVEQMPIIIAKHVFVTTFEGIGLSTTHDTCIYINTPFEEIIAYKKWIEENQATITEIKALRKYLTLKKIEAAEDDVPSPIKDTIEMPIKAHCWIKATAKVKSTSAPYWYMSCSTCYTAASETMAGRNFNCRYCTDTDATAVPRARAEVELSDSSDTITALMIGRPAEEFMTATASKLMGLTQAAMNFQDSIRLNMNEEHLFYIKTVSAQPWLGEHGRTVHARPMKKFEVVALDEYDLQKHYKIPVETIADQINTPSASGPKRALFQDDVGASNKKLLSKMD